MVGRDRPSMASPLEGLFYVGGDVAGRGVGVDAVAGSALRCADVVNDWLGETLKVAGSP